MKDSFSIARRHPYPILIGVCLAAWVGFGVAWLSWIFVHL
jgi:hypothetical protein